VTALAILGLLAALRLSSRAMTEHAEAHARVQLTQPGEYQRLVDEQDLREIRRTPENP
jgi:hypothetical protein